jgi:hypothetical protein
MPEIEVAEQAGVGLDGTPRPTEDRVVVLDNAVLVLDGVTSQEPGLPSGGWYSKLLATRLGDELRANPHRALDRVLADAIAAISAEHGLRPRQAPSSTVAMLRWTDDCIDTLVLADSPIVLFGQSCSRPVVDDRLSRLREGGKLRTRADVRAQRNVPGGFWVAEADPAAADHAVCASWPRADILAALVATDGVAAGIDDYHLFDWPQALEIARTEGPAALLAAVREAERQDPDGTRWPRAKRHDDQALALVVFE